MIESTKSEILIEDPMAEMFLDRLLDLADLKSKIDSDVIPFAYWDEISIMPHGETHWSGSSKGLIYGINHAIFDAWETLHGLNYGMEADAIVNFRKDHNGQA